QTETIETTPATTPDESLDLPPETAESSELDSPDKPSTEAIALPNDGARNGEKEAGAQPATDVALVPEQTGVESALEAATTPELKADSEAAESEETEATRVRIEKSAHLASAASSGENSQIEADSSATRTAPQSPPDAAGEGTSPAEIGNEAPRDDSNHQQRRDARNPRASEASKVAETTTPDKVEPAAGLTTELGKASSTSQQATENGNNAPIAPAEFGPSAKIAQTLLGKSVQRGTGDGTNLQGAEQARLINRVARAMTSAHDQGAPLRIRLSPPELGSIRLEIKVQDGALSARIEAETPAARAALLENVNDLRQRLAEQGIRIEQFDVDLNDQQGSGELPENVNHERDGDRPQDRNEDESRNATEIPSTHETKSDDQQLEGDSKLNVII
ncbi:MAG: flagellar hook-length control protein FliK, partial [Pirellulaceae bacterium]